VRSCWRVGLTAAGTSADYLALGVCIFEKLYQLLQTWSFADGVPSGAVTEVIANRLPRLTGSGVTVIKGPFLTETCSE